MFWFNYHFLDIKLDIVWFLLWASTFIYFKFSSLLWVNLSSLVLAFRPISYNHHFWNFSFLLSSIVFHHNSVLFVALIKIRLAVCRKRGMLCFYICKFVLIRVITWVHENVLNCLLSHVICTSYVSHHNWNWFLAGIFFTTITM